MSHSQTGLYSLSWREGILEDRHRWNRLQVNPQYCGVNLRRKKTAQHLRKLTWNLKFNPFLFKRKSSSIHLDDFGWVQNVNFSRVNQYWTNLFFLSIKAHFSKIHQSDAMYTFAFVHIVGGHFPVSKMFTDHHPPKNRFVKLSGYQ